MNRALKWLSLATTVIMYIVLQMGALVTNTGSQDGCGESWPLCKGTFLPDLDYATIIELSHRVVSGWAGMLTLVLAVVIWFTQRKHSRMRWAAVTALFFVCLQGGLGAAAVVWPQPKWALALHFGFSLICLSGVVLVTMLLYRKDRSAEHLMAPVPTIYRNWVWYVTGFTYIVAYLGAYVRHLKASLACTGWPLCSGVLIPPLEGSVGANFIHRLAAGLLVVFVIRMVMMTRRMAADRPDLNRAANWALILVLLQVAGGAVMALGYLNLLTQMLHSATISLYWAVLSYMCLQVLPEGEGASSPWTEAPAFDD